MDLRRPFFADGKKTEISSLSEIEPSIPLKGGLFYLRPADMSFFQLYNPCFQFMDLFVHSPCMKGFLRQLW